MEIMERKENKTFRIWFAILETNRELCKELCKCSIWLSDWCCILYGLFFQHFVNIPVHIFRKNNLKETLCKWFTCIRQTKKVLSNLTNIEDLKQNTRKEKENSWRHKRIKRNKFTKQEYMSFRLGYIFLSWIKHTYNDNASSQEEGNSFRKLE